MTKISVIFPVYNVNKYVKKSLLSILKQSFDDIEVIVVNDCSTDDSLKTIKGIDDNRITIINNKRNYGLAESRNIGMSHATGDLIYFMDSDDEIRPNFFEEIVKRFSADQDLDVVCFNYDKTNNLLNVDDLESIQLKWQKKLSSKSALLRLMDGSLSTTAWSYISRRAFLHSIKFRFSAGKLFEDMNTTSYMLSEASGIDYMFFSPSPYLYLQRSGSIMGKNKKKPDLKELNDNLFMITEEYRTFKKTFGNDSIVDHWLMNMLFYYYEFYYVRVHDKHLLEQYSSKISSIAAESQYVLTPKEKIKCVMVRFPILFTCKKIIERIRSCDL